MGQPSTNYKMISGVSSAEKFTLNILKVLQNLMGGSVKIWVNILYN